MPVEVFERLGLALERAWRGKSFDDALLPSLAQEALAAHFDRNLGYADIIRWIWSDGAMPAQHLPGSIFGSPPLTVFSCERFFIEALFWLEGRTAVHHHAFSGAFQLLCGSSVHCVYTFETRERIHAGFRLGDLTLIAAELLAPGDVRPLAAGSQLIHATFHLEKPTVSLVVRTVNDAGSGPQLSYHPPHVALESGDPPTLMDRRLKALDYLLIVKPTDYVSFATDLLERVDLEMSYRICRQAYRHLRGSHMMRTMIDVLRGRFGERADLIQRVLEADYVSDAFRIRREQTTDKELRFVLAILQNVPSRRRITELLEKRLAPARASEVLRRHAAAIVDDKTVDPSTLGDLLEGKPVPAEVAEQLRKAPLTSPLWMA